MQTGDGVWNDFNNFLKGEKHALFSKRLSADYIDNSITFFFLFISLDFNFLCIMPSSTHEL